MTGYAETPATPAHQAYPAGQHARGEAPLRLAAAAGGRTARATCFAGHPRGMSGRLTLGRLTLGRLTVGRPTLGDLPDPWAGHEGRLNLSVGWRPRQPAPADRVALILHAGRRLDEWMERRP